MFLKNTQKNNINNKKNELNGESELSTSYISKESDTFK